MRSSWARGHDHGRPEKDKLTRRTAEASAAPRGLYEVRFAGEQLDHDSTMKLLEAFNDSGRTCDHGLSPQSVGRDLPGTFAYQQVWLGHRCRRGLCGGGDPTGEGQVVVQDAR